MITVTRKQYDVAIGRASHKSSKPQIVQATDRPSHRLSKPQVVQATSRPNHRLSKPQVVQATSCPSHKLSKPQVVLTAMPTGPQRNFAWDKPQNFWGSTKSAGPQALRNGSASQKKNGARVRRRLGQKFSTPFPKKSLNRYVMRETIVNLLATSHVIDKKVD